MLKGRLNLPQALTVRYRGVTVGRLSMTPDNGRCAFEYDRGWLADGFSISPLELPLSPGLQLPKTNAFYGDFGIFGDSMPDGYENYLLDRLLRRYGLSLGDMSPVERLSFVGSGGMGALQYVPETRLTAAREAATASPTKVTSDLDFLFNGRKIARFYVRLIFECSLKDYG